MSTLTALYVDVGLLILSFGIYFYTPGKFFRIKPWFLGRDKAAPNLTGIDVT